MFWFTTLPLVLVLALAGVGTLLVRKGSRRINDHAHCKKCKFDLSAHEFTVDRGLERVLAAPGSSESERALCPECGTRLTPMFSLEFGTRRINWAYFAPGLVLIVLPYAFLVSTMFRSGGMASVVVRHAPESLVMRLGERDRGLLVHAELVRRVQDGELSADALQGLAARTVARGSQPVALGRPRVGGEPLVTALVDAGAITPEGLLTMLGEPTVRIRTDVSTYRTWAPVIVVDVAFPTPNVPEHTWVSLENVVAYVSDSGDRRGAMALSQIADGLVHGGALTTSASASHAWMRFSLLPTLLEARSVKVETPTREIYLQADVVIRRNGVQVGRVARVAFDAAQNVFDPFEVKVGLDMDPGVNAAARASYEGLMVRFWPSDATATARMLITWPADDSTMAHAYRMSVRAAGMPDSLPLFVASIPTREGEMINGRPFGGVISPGMVDTRIRAVDITFEPDPIAAAWRVHALTVSRIPGAAFTIPGEAFTIRDVATR